MLGAIRAKSSPFMTASSCRCASTRIPRNHSLQIPGLIKSLHKIKDFLSEDVSAPPVRTIVPGRVAKARGPSEAFTIKITTETDRGFKGLARLGSQVQEVFFVGGSRESLERAIARQIPSCRGSSSLRTADRVLSSQPAQSPRLLHAENERIASLLARHNITERRLS